MATDIDSLQIEIQGTARGANKSINQLIKNLDNLQSSIQRVDTSKFKNFSMNTINLSNSTKKLSGSLNTLSASAKSSTKTFGSLASSFGKFYANFFWVIRGLKGVRDAIDSTADYVEAFNYYTVSFGKVASKWDSEWTKYADENAKNYANEFVTTLNDSFKKLSGVSFDPQTGLLSSTGLKNLGLNLQEVTQYAAQLASMMDSIGQSGKTTLATTNAFVKLAGDISSLYNIDYSEAGSAIRSVLQGQSRAGYKFGWDTTMASLQATADKLDLSKAVSEMTQMEKQQLRILTILEQSRVAWGDQSNTINTLANQMRMFKNNMAEAGMLLGQLFVPLMQNLMPIINGVTIAIKDMLSSFAMLFGIKIEDTGQGFTETEDNIDGVTDSLDGATESANKLKKALRPLDKLNLITTTNSNENDNGNTVDLTKQILSATQEYEKAWQQAYERMESKAQDFAKRVSSALEPVKKIFQDFAIGDYFQAGQDVSNLVVSINQFLTNAIQTVDWDKVGENIGNFIKGINWTEVLDSFGVLFWGAINSAIKTWDSSFETAPIETAITTAIAVLTFTDLGKKVSKKIAKAISDSLVKSEIINILRAGFGALFGSAAAKSALSFFGKAQILFAGIGTLISGLVLSVSSFVSMFIDGFSWIKEAIMLVGIALTAVGAIILGAPALVAGVVAGIVATVATLVIVIKDNWENICNFFTQLGTAFSEVWNAIIYVLTTNVLPEISREFKNTVNGIIGFFEGMANGVIDAINFIIKGLNKIKFDVPDWVPVIGGKEFGFNITTVKKVNLPKFSTGGFPEDGLFFANHNELIGQFSNGQTAVANNEQIVAGIERGVERAVTKVLAPYLADIADSSRRTANKEFGITSREAFSAVRTEANNYTRRTGQPAFV